jgi:hypothetical protein
MVFEWDHRLVLLEPFHMRHKGKFARSAALDCMKRGLLHFRANAAVQHVRRNSSERDKLRADAMAHAQFSRRLAPAAARTWQSNVRLIVEAPNWLYRGPSAPPMRCDPAHKRHEQCN